MPLPLPRALLLLAGLVSLGPTACAAQAVQPSHDPSCIEAYKPYRRARTRYRIAGVPATREEVESIVHAMPGDRERLRRNRIMTGVGGALLGTGTVGDVSGIVASASSSRPAFLALAGAGAATAIAGILVLMNAGDPLSEGMAAFNEQARRAGFCLSPQRTLPPPPAAPPIDPWSQPAPPEGIPQLPSREWIP